MSPALIIAAVFAVYLYLRDGDTATYPRIPYFRSKDAVGINTGFTPPATTGSTDGLSGNEGPVTQQPGTSGSGVPSSSLITRDFGNTLPGFTTSWQPFYSAGRDLFSDRNLRKLQPVSLNSGKKHGGCCDGCSNGDGNGCSSCKTSGRGNCASAPSGDISSQTPIKIDGYNRAVKSDPLTLAGQLNNLIDSPFANRFNTAQWQTFDIETADGQSPAAPTYFR